MYTPQVKWITVIYISEHSMERRKEAGSSKEEETELDALTV